MEHRHAVPEGFEYEGIWIENPYLSECGRFEVDPKEYYGIDVEEKK
jgi:hypothetical protein